MDNTHLDIDRLLVLVGVSGSEFKEIFLTPEQKQMILQCVRNIYSPGKIKIINQELKITTNDNAK